MSSYYNINIKVRCGKIVFNEVQEITIERTSEKITDTAKIVLPREFSRAKRNNKEVSLANTNILEYISVGDIVEISAGYNDKFSIEFKGYISRIGANIPLVIECEDEMYKLKNSALINKTYKDVTLEKLLKDIAPEYKINAIDMSLGKFMIERASPYKVLQELKRKYAVRSYFTDKTLNSGLLINMKPQKTHYFDFCKNIRKSSNLDYKTQGKQRLYITAVSMQKGGVKKNVICNAGDKGGSEITLHAPMNMNKAQLEKWTKDCYKSRTREGYEGTIDGFMYPVARVGGAANIIDPNYKDGHRNGRYYIESVKTIMNKNVGILRKTKISFKL